MECHAFLCPKRKVTQAVTLTVAKSFNAAYEAWRKNEEKRNLIMGECSKSIEAAQQQNSTPPKASSQQRIESNGSTKDNKSNSMLIDFNSDNMTSENENIHHNSWVCFYFVCLCSPHFSFNFYPSFVSFFFFGLFFIHKYYLLGF